MVFFTLFFCRTNEISRMQANCDENESNKKQNTALEYNGRMAEKKTAK